LQWVETYQKGANNTATTLQYGENNYIITDQVGIGYGNTSYAVQDGKDITASVTQFGANESNLYQYTDTANADVIQGGFGNVSNVTQTD
jgi:hypothetical protein